MVPADPVTVTVANSWMTLNGTLNSYFQIAAAERAVRHLPGVKGVSYSIVLQAPTTTSIRTSDVAAAIEAAFRRSAETERAVAAFERPQNRKRS